MKAKSSSSIACYKDKLYRNVEQRSCDAGGLEAEIFKTFFPDIEFDVFAAAGIY